MDGTDSLRLDEIAEVTAGNPAPQDLSDFSEVGEPFVRMQDVGRCRHTRTLGDSTDHITAAAAEKHRLRKYPTGTLLIPKSGASVNLNHRALLSKDAYVVSHLATIIPDRSKVDPDYLYFWSLTYDPRHQAQVTSLPSLPTSLIKAAAVPVPSLAKQRRIVDLLSRGEIIVRMRREAEQNAKEIIPALFVDMFGDPATNPKGGCIALEGHTEGRREAVHFGQLGTLDRGRSRHRPRDAANLYGGAFPFVQTGDVTRSGGVISSYSQTYSDAGLAQSKLWPAGTLCITIAANIAETGILQFDACFPDSVVGFLPGPQVRTAYIQQWLSFLQPTLAAQAPQAAQKNINLAILKGLQVAVPSLDAQDSFTRHVGGIRTMQMSQKSATDYAEQTFQSLLAAVFGEGG